MADEQEPNKPLDKSQAAIEFATTVRQSVARAASGPDQPVKVTMGVVTAALWELEQWSRAVREVLLSIDPSYTIDLPPQLNFAQAYQNISGGGSRPPRFILGCPPADTEENQPAAGVPPRLYLGCPPPEIEPMGSTGTPPRLYLGCPPPVPGAEEKSGKPTEGSSGPKGAS